MKMPCRMLATHQVHWKVVVTGMASPEASATFKVYTCANSDKSAMIAMEMVCVTLMMICPVWMAAVPYVRNWAPLMPAIMA